VKAFSTTPISYVNLVFTECYNDETVLALCGTKSASTCSTGSIVLGPGKLFSIICEGMELV
jgi:hypothetical protein